MVKKIYVKDYDLPQEVKEALDAIGLNAYQRVLVDRVFRSYRHALNPELSVERERRLIEDFKKLVEYDEEVSDVDT